MTPVSSSTLRLARRRVPSCLSRRKKGRRQFPAPSRFPPHTTPQGTTPTERARVHERTRFLVSLRAFLSCVVCTQMGGCQGLVRVVLAARA